MELYWMFGGSSGDQVIVVTDLDLDPAWGEDLISCEEPFAQWLAKVPPKYRWEAAQGENWSPSKGYAEWLRTFCDVS